MTVHTIDLDYRGIPGTIASYVIIGPEGPVMIECGPGSTSDALTRGLRDLDLEPRDVGHVLVTHIHFDHAGASGWMARHGAQVHVHEFGARHLVDPSRLMASARRIYGDSMDERWGELLPIPESQVNKVHDGDVLKVGGLEILAIETPGHARHHHAFAVDMEQERICFTGDAAGTFVTECLSYVSLPTPPPEFDLEAWITTIDRLERMHFDRLYATHFGPTDAADHLPRVAVAIHEHANLVRELMEEGLTEEEMLARYTDWFAGEARAAGVPEIKMGFYVTDTIATMNLMGLRRYWAKKMEQSTAV